MTDSKSDQQVPPIDVSVLEQLARDIDVAIIPNLIEISLKDGSERLAQIKSALASCDDTALAAAIHALAGNAASCGLMELSHTLNECENSFRRDDAEGGRASAARVLALAPSAFELLSDYLKTLD
jgi:HPt (histidine-containing phosphotransfer) domain-containing protein